MNSPLCASRTRKINQQVILLPGRQLTERIFCLPLQVVHLADWPEMGWLCRVIKETRRCLMLERERDSYVFIISLIVKVSNKSS